MEPIIFELRDIYPDVVRAWEKYFIGVANVRISHGDIFEVSADAIVSPANSFGYMDGGIDLVYLHRFGWELQARLQGHLRDEHDGELPVGQAIIVETHHAAIPYLVSAPTMRIPMNVSNTVNAHLAFRAAIRAVKLHNRERSQAASRCSRCPDYVRLSEECPLIWLQGRWQQPSRRACSTSRSVRPVIDICWGLEIKSSLRS